MLKNLLVHIPSELPTGSVVDAAISLATTHTAHLDAVSIGYAKLNTKSSVDGGTAATEREHALQRANAALAAFETEARKAGVSYALNPLAGLPAEAAKALDKIARLHDLTVVAQPDRHYNTFDNVMHHEFLFESGGPVLFIPHVHKGPFDPKHIGIAWDGSRLAARALRDASPFLTHAHAVTIISINEVPGSANASAADLAAHLARHGLTARIERADAGHAEIQPLMLSIATDIDVNLLVRGGYGRGGLEEFIMGGVTHDMLHSMKVPTLMSH